MAVKLQQRSAGQWWRQFILLLAAFTVCKFFPLSSVLRVEPRGMVFFVLALLMLFASRKPFHKFKQAVIELGTQPLRLQQPELWQGYFSIRKKALWYASAPGFLACVGALNGLEGVAQVLLLFASLLLFWLYRTPRQLWYVLSSS